MTTPRSPLKSLVQDPPTGLQMPDRSGITIWYSKKCPADGPPWGLTDQAWVMAWAISKCLTGQGTQSQIPEAHAPWGLTKSGIGYTLTNLQVPDQSRVRMWDFETPIFALMDTVSCSFWKITILQLRVDSVHYKTKTFLIKAILQAFEKC